MSSTTTPKNATPPIVCLVSHAGSRLHLEVARTWFSLQGQVVIEIECGSQRLERLEAMTQSKLELCNEVVVLNNDGCITEGMRAVIRGAQRLGKTVRFYERERYQTRISAQRADRALAAADAPQEVLGSGNGVSLDAPFLVKSGAVLLFGPDPSRPAFTLVADHVWPGIQHVPEVWYAEAISDTAIEAFEADRLTLQSVGQVIRWAVTTSGQVIERVLCALHVLGSAHTQEELSAVIGCRRESVTAAMRDLKAGGLVEKSAGRIRLSAKGIVAALRLFDPERLEDEDDAEFEDFPPAMTDPPLMTRAAVPV